MQDLITESNVLTNDLNVIDHCVSLCKGKKIKTPDAIFAATALGYGHTICTANEKDFANIKGLRIINPMKNRY